MRWYIQLEGKIEGPYSFEELSERPSIYPNMKVRRRFHLFWKKAKHDPLLKPLFEDYYLSFRSKNRIFTPGSELALTHSTLSSSIKPLPFYVEIILLLLLLLLIYLAL